MHGIFELPADGERQVGGAQLGESQPDGLGIIDRVSPLYELVGVVAHADRKIFACLRRTSCMIRLMSRSRPSSVSP